MTATRDAPPRGTRAGLHRAWWVALVTLGVLVAAAGFRSSVGAMLEPLEETFGWSRATTSGAVSLNLVVYGVTAPFAAALIGRFGIRRVLLSALLLVAAGSGLTTLMTAAWQLWVLWGLVIGVGTGSMALVLGAIVADRWFETHRGLVTGLFSAASSGGQLLFLPLVAHLVAGPGWRTAALAVALGSLMLLVPVALLMSDGPERSGLRKYGAAPVEPGTEVLPPLPPRPQVGAARTALQVLAQASRSPVFWVLAGTFFVCGWSTNGLIQTHFVPAAHDHGMPATTSAGLLALIGVFDMIGTVASGWLTDRVDPRLLLFAYYGLRGLSLLGVPLLLGPHVVPSLFHFVVFYGLDWVATVPPTIALCRRHFGDDGPIVFGWVLASHQVGASVVAYLTGLVRDTFGSYDVAWTASGALCGTAALMALVIRARPTGVPAPDGPAQSPRPRNAVR
jgi:predicted MFS family arabinose efflux permease